MANDSTFTPTSSIAFLPFWNPFSITIPTPTGSAPACLTISIRPKAAHPLARKSSIIRTLSPLLRYFLLTFTLYLVFLVKENTSDS